MTTQPKTERGRLPCRAADLSGFANWEAGEPVVPIIQDLDGGWDAVPSFREISWALAPLPVADTLSITDTYRHLALAAVESLHDLHCDYRKLQAANARLLVEFRDVRASRLAAA